MLHRINPTTIEIKGFNPPQNILNHLFRCISILPIHIRHVVSEQAFEAILCPIASWLTADASLVEPVRMLDVIRMVFVDMVHNEVTHHTDACIVSSINKSMEIILRTNTRINTPRLYWPIPVIGGNFVHTIGSESGSVCTFVERGKPKGVHTEISEVTRLNPLRHTLKIAAHPVCTLGRFW